MLRFLGLSLIVLSQSAFAGDCVSIMGKIPFSGHWIFTDGANFVGGDLPDFGFSEGRFQIMRRVSSGEWTGNTYGGRISFRESGFFPGGVSRPYPSYPAGAGRPFGPFGRPGTTNIDGTIELSSKAREDIRKAIVKGSLRLPGIDRTNPDLMQVCVSDLAMNVGRQNMSFGGQLRGGTITLYLNDTNEYYSMRF